MQAGVPAQVLGAGAQAAARIPRAQTKFSAPIAGYEPVIRLLHFGSADIA
jgi:hypothetical protein